MTKKRLLISISSHGFGHFSMTAPVINQLLAENNVEIILRTQVPEYLIQSRLNAPVTIIHESADFGMKMDSSLDVDFAQSAAAYKTLHSQWDKSVEQEMESLQAIKPDLILANIPYLTLAAASRLKIPSLAYCSLNWADITLSYFKNEPEFVNEYIPQMNDAYNSAEKFICPAPSMNMPGLRNVENVGPVCTIGKDRKQEILTQFDLLKSSRLVLISAGGVPTPIPVNDWPVIDNVVWVCAWSARFNRQDIISLSDLSLPFPDLTASADLIVTKPGYGTVSESVCLAKPALYVRRPDWAEEPGLIDWWHRNGVAKEISRTQFFSGDFVNELHELVEMPAKQRHEPVGIMQVVEIINSYL